jgi:hypothetical protein
MPAKLNAAFWKWFGDSVVRTEDGMPMVVYHGTQTKEIREFRMDKKSSDYGDTDLGFFFSGAKRCADEFGAMSVDAYLSMKNPVHIDALEFFNIINDHPDWYARDFRRLRRQYIKAGHDGIIVSADANINRLLGPGWGQFDCETYIVFRPEQIKSIDNNGTWDADDPNIRSNPQRHTSSGTSIKQIAGVFKAWQRDGGGFQGINLDIGGGKYDAVQAWMSKNGINCVNLVWDKFNRSAEHNDAVLEAVADHGGADSVTIANVLNVIDDKKARRDVLLMAEQYAKIGAPVLILIYEGNKSGIGATPPKRPDDWQNNLKAEAYEHEIASVFGEVLRSGKIFLARAGDRHTRRFARRAGR